MQQETWSRVVGYVEQCSIHSPTTTAREALQISARLRLSRSVCQQQVMAVVDEMLDVVDLVDMQHSIVGDREVLGLTVEQRKRLSIAVELVANPR